MAQTVVESKMQRAHSHVAVLRGTCEEEKKNCKDIELWAPIHVVGR